MPPVEVINPTTYEATLTGGDKVEINTTTKPYIKLNGFGGECWIKLQMAGDIEGEVEYELDGDKVKTKYKIKYGNFEQEVETDFYPLEPLTVIAKDKDGKNVEFTQNELGGFEFEIILKKKPLTNKIVLDIETQGLRFAYQPPLHPDHPTWNDRSVRPENVVGSYAVNHATRTKWHASPEDAEKYKTCKMGQFYYPYLIDAEGWKVRAEDFKIDTGKGLLTITLPQQFLDSATYPIIVDPNFGLTGTGDTWTVIANEDGTDRWGSAWTMPASGTANYIKAYVRSAGDSPIVDCKVFINQKDSGGADIHGQIATKENLACAAAEHWEEFTLADEALTVAVVYILSIIGNHDDLVSAESYQIASDSAGVSVAMYWTPAEEYTAPENPWTQSPMEEVYVDFSIYCNYDEEAGGVNYPISLSPGLTASATVDRDVAWDRGMSPGLTTAITIAYKAAWDRSVAPGLKASVTILKGWGRTITTTANLNVSATVSVVKGFVKSIISNLTVAVASEPTDWLSGWNQRVKLTIDQNDIDALLTWHPVPVFLGTSVGHSSRDVSFVFDELQNDGNRKKIALTKADGVTQLYCEIEKWDHANEKAVLHISRDGWEIASGADTDLYLYYDSGHADNDSYVGDTNDVVAENVWDSNFKAVYHMADGVDTSNIYDSTLNDNDGVKTGAAAPAKTTSGKIADAQDFDGGDDRVNLGNAASLDFASGDFTVELWYYATGWTEPEQRFLWYGDTSAGDGNKKWWGLHGLVTADKLQLSIDDNITKRDAEIAPLPAEGAWHHLVGVRNSGGTNYLYLDGGVPGSVVDNGNSITQTTYKDTYIGVGLSAGGFLRYFNGLIDEVRLSDTARTAEWVKASYESERDHLLDFGEEETLSGITGITRTVAYHRDPLPGLTLAVTIVTTFVGVTHYLITVVTNLTASATIVKGWGRAVATSTDLTISATVSRKVAYTRATTAGLTAAVSILKGWGRAIATTADLTLSVTILKSWGRKITTSADLAISTTINKVVAFKRAVSANLMASVTIVKVFGRKITTTTGLTVNAVISKLVAYKRTTLPGLTIAVTIVATLAGITQYLITVVANLTVSTMVSKMVVYKRSTQANLSVAVTIVKLRARTIITTANLTINTIISRVVAYNRIIQAGLSIAVSVARQFSRTIIMSPNLTINVLVDRVVAWNRATSSGLTIAVTLIRGFGHTITTTANLVIDVTITRGFGWVITTTANLTVSVIVRYCVGLRELLRVSIDRLDAQRLTISRMAISRVPISRKEIWRRIRSCFP